MCDARAVAPFQDRYAMIPHHRLIDAARATRKTLYVVAAFYVAVGFFIAAPAAMSGDRLSTFLGFLIISGALACATIFRAVWRLTQQAGAMNDSLDQVAVRLERFERNLKALAAPTRDTSSVQMIDLASFGAGDPSVLAAARLDRDAFPRLVTTMETDPPATSTEPAGKPRSPASSCKPQSPAAKTDSAPKSPPGGSGDRPTPVTTRNLLREWKVGLRNGDLAACSGVYSALVDTAEPEALRPLRIQLEQLADRTERSLRARIVRCLHDQDFEGMIETGKEIETLLGDRPVAEEFARIKPHLLARIKADEQGTAHSLRVVH